MKRGKCMLCGERRYLEEHHINRWLDEELTILVCRNCHLNIQALVEPFRPPDALSYCELGRKFTNLCMNIPIRVLLLKPHVGLCMDYRFCAVNECRYKPKNARTVLNAIMTLIGKWQKPKRGVIIEGRLRITDDEGRFWLQREDVIKWLLSLINDDKRRQELDNWYKRIKENLLKIEVDEHHHRILIRDFTLERFL